MHCLSEMHSCSSTTPDHIMRLCSSWRRVSAIEEGTKEKSTQRVLLLGFLSWVVYVLSFFVVFRDHARSNSREPFAKEKVPSTTSSQTLVSSVFSYINPSQRIYKGIEVIRQEISRRYSEWKAQPLRTRRRLIMLPTMTVESFREFQLNLLDELKYGTKREESGKLWLAKLFLFYRIMRPNCRSIQNKPLATSLRHHHCQSTLQGPKFHR